MNPAPPIGFKLTREASGNPTNISKASGINKNTVDSANLANVVIPLLVIYTTVITIINRKT